MQTYSENSLYWGAFSPDSGIFRGEDLFLYLQNGNYITCWCDAFLNHRPSCEVNPPYLLHDVQPRCSWFAEYSVYGTGHTSPSSSSFPAKQTGWLLLKQIHSQLLGPALCWVQPRQSLCSRFPFLISSSFLFAVDFYPSTRQPALLKLNKYSFSIFWQMFPKVQVYAEKNRAHSSFLSKSSEVVLPLSK